MGLFKFKYVFGKNYSYNLYLVKHMYKIFDSCVIMFVI
jgi:hypothetical protein